MQRCKPDCLQWKSFMRLIFGILIIFTRTNKALSLDGSTYGTVGNMTGLRIEKRYFKKGFLAGFGGLFLFIDINLFYIESVHNAILVLQWRLG